MTKKKGTRLRARYFAVPNGPAIPKARPLHGAERRRIFNRDGGKCQACERPLKLFRSTVRFLDGHSLAHIDHVFPRSRGGQNDDDNLRLLCESCNESKGAKLDKEWPGP